MRINKTLTGSVKPPSKGQSFYRDDQLKGFTLRDQELRGRGPRRRQNAPQYAPGYGRLTVEQARKLAQQYLDQVAGGTDPVAEERAQRASRVTLGEAFDW